MYGQRKLGGVDVVAIELSRFYPHSCQSYHSSRSTRGLLFDERFQHELDTYVPILQPVRHNLQKRKSKFVEGHK